MTLSILNYLTRVKRRNGRATILHVAPGGRDLLQPGRILLDSGSVYRVLSLEVRRRRGRGIVGARVVVIGGRSRIRHGCTSWGKNVIFKLA